VNVIERGAFDFIVPPLSEPELLHVVRIATENALRRRRQNTVALPPASLAAVVRYAARESEHAIAGVED